MKIWEAMTATEFTEAGKSLKETIAICAATKPMKHTWSVGARANAYTRMMKDCGREEVAKNATDAIRRQDMKNTLGDLNNHLFAQLEKLGDDDLTGEELESELKRTDAICDISEQIIKNGELQYKAMKHMDEYGYERQKAVPEMLEVHAGGRTINERLARRSDRLAA